MSENSSHKKIWRWGRVSGNGGRRWKTSVSAMLCAIFHSVVTAVLQLLMSYTLHYFTSLDWTHFCSLCHPVAMQSSKASPKETADWSSAQPSALRQSQWSSSGVSGHSAVSLQSWIKPEVFVMLSALEAPAEWACDWHWGNGSWEKRKGNQKDRTSGGMGALWQLQ